MYIKMLHIMIYDTQKEAGDTMPENINNTTDKNLNSKENKKPAPKGDVDDFIFKNEEIKPQKD